MDEPGPASAAQHPSSPTGSPPAHQWPPEVVAAVAERVLRLLLHEQAIWDERTGRRRAESGRRQL